MKALLTIFCCSLLLACRSDEGGSAGSHDGGSAGSVVTAVAAQRTPEDSAATPSVENTPTRPVIEQTLAYGEGQGRNLVGYLAMPEDAIEPLPGVIVIHERWGLNDDIKSLTRRIATEGYVALAVDLYDGARAETPGAAQELMTSVRMNQDLALANLRQAYEYLDKYAFAPRVGVIGRSLGGGLALQTALMLPEDLDAVVMYYGQVITDEQELASLQTPILGLFGAQDTSISAASVQAFRASLRELGKRADVLIFSDVGHAFADASGEGYDAATAEEAWSKTLEFLALNL